MAFTRQYLNRLIMTYSYGIWVMHTDDNEKEDWTAAWFENDGLLTAVYFKRPYIKHTLVNCKQKILISRNQLC